MKRARLVVSGIIIFILIVIVLIYSRPMTLAQMCAGIDVAESENVHGYYFIAPATEDAKFEIGEEDEMFSRITDLFSSRKFRRSVRSLFPQGTKVHSYKNGDFKWEVMFRFTDVKLPNGDICSGEIIRVSNFFGKLEVHFNGKVWRCSTRDQDAWLNEVMSIISTLNDK